MANKQKPLRLQNPHFESKIKNVKEKKTWQKRFYNTLQLFFAKKQLEKKVNIPKMRPF